LGVIRAGGAHGKGQKAALRRARFIEFKHNVNSRSEPRARSGYLFALLTRSGLLRRPAPIEQNRKSPFGNEQ
jgi:hypothetical protein